jgi:N-acetyl-alpha-D-glucosaminyl L-malate synthase BshA
MKPLRIAVACFPTLGGSGIVATGVGTELAARGHFVRFFAPEAPARLDLGAPRISFQRVSSQANLAAESDVYPLALATALTEAASEGFDVIHAHYAVPHAMSALLARAMLRRVGQQGPRIVTTLHGTDVTSLGTEPSLRAVIRYVAEASDALSVPSAWLRDQAIQLLGLAQVPIEVIANFVDPAVFHPRPGDLRHLFPKLAWPDDPKQRPRVMIHGSNFRSVKRVGDAVRVLDIVQRSREAALVLIGDGPERSAVEALCARLDLAARVSFLGPLAHFSELLARADLFLLPSATESFGLSALEALASGVPVVASAVGGLPEVVRDRVTGLLVPPAQPEAMAAAVLSLLNDEPMRRAMAEAARADALARFATKPAIDRYEQLLIG